MPATTVDQLQAYVEQYFALGRERAYVEVGEGKQFLRIMVRALALRGYRIVASGLQAFHIYPKEQAA